MAEIDTKHALASTEKGIWDIFISRSKLQEDFSDYLDVQFFVSDNDGGLQIMAQPGFVVNRTLNTRILLKHTPNMGSKEYMFIDRGNGRYETNIRPVFMAGVTNMAMAVTSAQGLVGNNNFVTYCRAFDDWDNLWIDRNGIVRPGTYYQYYYIPTNGMFQLLRENSNNNPRFSWSR